MQVLLRIDTAAYFGLIGTIAAAGIAVLGAALLHFHAVGRTIRDRKREVCAKAIADALAWLELPYRVRRRCDDSPATLTALVGRIHDLQERLAFDESWVRIEIPQAYPGFFALIAATRDAAREPLRDAWDAPPAQGPRDMNLGKIAMPSVDAYVEAFADAVRSHI